MLNPTYHISTGFKTNYYTLRYAFDEVVSSGLTRRDYHVRNLSLDKETAIAKAREITGLDLTASFDVFPIGEGQPVDWSILQSGKHRGKSIHEVNEVDRPYLIWLAENLPGSKAYGPTVELCQAFLKDELDTRRKESLKKATKLQRRKAKAILILTEAASILESRSKVNGDFCHSIATDIRSGVIPTARGRSIALDIIAKTFGRGKRYDAAYDSFSRRFTLADKLTSN